MRLQMAICRYCGEELERRDGEWVTKYGNDPQCDESPYDNHAMQPAVQPFCSQCDASHDAADCPHRPVLGEAVSGTVAPLVPAREHDTEWDRDKGRWW